MIADIRERIAANIQNCGQHLAGVETSPGDPADFEPFVYTIGNHEAGLPELLFVGDNDTLHCDILNILGKMQRERGSAFAHGERVDYTARFPALLIACGQKARDEYAVQAGVYYHTEQFDVLQVLFADQNGKYPGEPGCLPPYSKQTIITPYDPVEPLA